MQGALASLPPHSTTLARVKSPPLAKRPLRQVGIRVAEVVGDFVTKPLRPSEDGFFRWKLDFGDDEAGVGTVEFIDFSAGTFVEDDLACFVDQGLKTERDEFLRRFDRQGKFDLGSRNAFGFAFDGHPGLLAADSHTHGAFRITCQVALHDAQAL